MDVLLCRCRPAVRVNTTFAALILLSVSCKFYRPSFHTQLNLLGTAIIISRTWALFDRNRNVLWVLLGGYFVCFLPAIILVAHPPVENTQELDDYTYVMEMTSNIPDLRPLLGGCYWSEWTTGFIYLFVAMLVYESSCTSLYEG